MSPKKFYEFYLVMIELKKCLLATAYEDYDTEIIDKMHRLILTSQVVKNGVQENRDNKRL
jgi:hypothetical protein